MCATKLRVSENIRCYKSKYYSYSNECAKIGIVTKFATKLSYTHAKINISMKKDLVQEE